MPNDDLFLRVLAQIEAAPDSWNQHNWARRGKCGTQYCIAGWACVLSGRQVRWDEDLPASISGTLEDRVAIGSAARELLGLTERAADLLFHLPTDLDLVYTRIASYLGLDEQVLRDKVQAELPV